MATITRSGACGAPAVLEDPGDGGWYTGEERSACERNAGGNFLVISADRADALAGAKAAAEKICGTKNVCMSFAGGIVGSGSKVGCKNYRFPMPASTNHRWCPALKGKIPDSLVPDGTGAVYEIVINGFDEASVAGAMREGIGAAAATGKVRYIGASNFDGKLGQTQINLHEILR